MNTLRIMKSCSKVYVTPKDLTTIICPDFLNVLDLMVQYDVTFEDLFRVLEARGMWGDSVDDHEYLFDVLHDHLFDIGKIKPVE